MILNVDEYGTKYRTLHSVSNVGAIERGRANEILQ